MEISYNVIEAKIKITEDKMGGKSHKTSLRSMDRKWLSQSEKQ